MAAAVWSTLETYNIQKKVCHGRNLNNILLHLDPLTCTPMLSMTHAIFRGLQEDLRDILRDLPDTVFPPLKKGLLDAHLKLSDYYHKIDESLYYLWSSHRS